MKKIVKKPGDRQFPVDDVSFTTALSIRAVDDTSAAAIAVVALFRRHLHAELYNCSVHNTPLVNNH